MLKGEKSMNEIDRILDSIPPHEQLATDINMLVASYYFSLLLLFNIQI